MQPGLIPQPHDRHRSLRITIVVILSVISALILVLVGIYSFLGMVMGLGGHCDNDRSSPVCGELISWALILFPLVGLFLGFLVVTIGPWLSRPKPRPVWSGVGIGIQLLTVVATIITATITMG